MDDTTCRTAAEMAKAHPNVQGAAIRFRVTRLLKGEEAARLEAGPALSLLIDRWHDLQRTGPAPLWVVA